MTRVLIETFMILLSLKNVYQVSTSNCHSSNVKDLIFALLFMVWWIWNSELLLILGIINLQKTKFWKTVFIANAIKP